MLYTVIPCTWIQCIKTKAQALNTLFMHFWIPHLKSETWV